MRHLYAILLIGFALTGPAGAETYQSPEDFLDEVFAAGVPQPEVVWLTGSVRDAAADILGHNPAQMRLRYWRVGPRTAWILEEIGKEKPITTGIVINADRIELVRVLIFRESRGWEIRHSFFTDQFKQAGLSSDRKVDARIDGISGATLSVRALTNLARLALFLHQQIPAAHATP
jgi:hypothetical protein